MKSATKASFGLDGEVRWKVIGPDGEIKSEGKEDNLVVDSGIIALIDRMTNASPDSTCLIEYIGVGTGSTTPAAGDTTLETEVARKQQTSRTHSNKVAAIATLFNAGDIPGTPTTINECGLFIEGSATLDTGTLLARVATSISVTAVDSLFIDWRITGADA